MKKVYCGECRHYSSGDYGHYCDVIDITGADWFGKTQKLFNPEKQNANNQCQYWEHKRGLLEWIHDLII